MVRNPQLFPGWAAVYAIFFPEGSVDGRRVFFVEPAAAVREAHRRGRRSADLFAAPEEVPEGVEVR